MNQSKKLKLLIIGLDGAGFNSLQPWIDKGCMPALKQIIESGVSADLISTIPPITAPAWTSFMTGQNPGKHGLFSFFKYKNGFENPSLSNLKDIKHQKIWNYLNQAGLKTGVADLPLTYPPERLDGVMVSNLMTAGSQEATTYPEDLKKELIDNLNASFDTAILDKLSQTSSYLKHLIFSVEDKLEMDSYLIERYELDCFITVYSQTDTIQHYFWKYFDEQHPLFSKKKADKFHEYFLRFYRQVDTAIDSLSQYLGEGSSLVFVSDHGFGPINRVINLNRFLLEIGVLKCKNNRNRTKNRKFHLNIDYRKILGLLSRLDVFRLKERLSRKLRDKIKTNFETRLGQMIDYKRSAAFFGHSMDQGVFINKDHISIRNSQKKYEEFRNKIKNYLSTLKDPNTGKYVFEGVYNREKIYTGDRVDQAPDIILKIAPEYFCHSGISSRKIVEDQNVEFASGDHRPEGIFIARGKCFQENKRIDRLNIIDVLPTVLYSCGLPVPENLDGKVIREIFKSIDLS